MDRFLRACLLTIILLLALDALRPVLTPPTVHAVSQYKYLTVQTNNTFQDMQELLDKYANDGWELAEAYNSERFGNVLILRKAR
jgi:hypothetical protein